MLSAVVLAALVAPQPGSAAAQNPSCGGQVATIVGTKGPNLLFGTSGPDVIVAGGGRDVVLALGGDDIVCAGPGNDLVLAGGGDDLVFGGRGRDGIFGNNGRDVLDGQGSADTVAGGQGDDDVSGGGGNDLVFGDGGDDLVRGDGGSDRLSGGEGADRLDGGAGRDTLRGDGGDDGLQGGRGRDRMDGGTGDDRLDGGAGNDRLDGGAGDDVLRGDAGFDRLDGGPDRDDCVPMSGTEVNCEDVEPPMLVAPAAITVEAGGPAGATVELGEAFVRDAVDPGPVVTNDAPGAFPLGTTTVTWTATDASGNTATDSQVVTVVDTAPPVITAPADLTIESQTDLPVSDPAIAGFLTGANVTDLVDPAPVVAQDAPSVFPLGTTLVTFTATDASGNQANATATVTVAEPSPGQIGGFVWDDLNADGLQDAAELGIAGVTVNLHALDEEVCSMFGCGFGTRLEPGPVQATTATDDDGLYSFDAVTPGEPFVVRFVSPDDYQVTDPDVGGGDAIDSDLQITGTAAPAGIPVELAPGEALDLDVGYVVQSAFITGVVWLDLDGNGLRDDTPLLHLPLSVRVLDATTLAVVAETTTTSVGYELAVDAGSYVVEFGPQLPPDLLFSPADQGDDALDSDVIDPAAGRTATLTVAAGEVVYSVDAGVRPGPGSVEGFVWDDLDRDGIQGAGEPGLAGVVVRLHAPDEIVCVDPLCLFPIPEPGPVLAEAQTDASGAYSFDDAPGGQDLVVRFATPAGYGLTTPDVGGDDTIDSDMPLPTTAPTARTGVVVNLDPGGTAEVDAGYRALTVSVSPTSGLTTTEDGGTAVFAVVLDDAPLGDVTIPVSVSDTTEGSVDGAELVFTTADWPLPRLVTVTGVDDTDDDGDVAYTVVVGEAVGGGYDGIDPDDVEVTNVDDDEPASGSIGDRVWQDLNENGLQDDGEPGFDGVDMFLLHAGTLEVLDSTVTDGAGLYRFVGLPAGSYVVRAGFQEGFFPTMVGAGDDDADSDIDGETLESPAVALTDSQAIDTIDAGFVVETYRGVTVSPTSGLATSEAGATTSFTVVLDDAPFAAVTIPMSVSDVTEGSVDVAELVFTTTDWDQPKTVTITGVDDDEVDGDVVYTVAIDAASGGGYGGIDPDDVTVTNIDDDTLSTDASIGDIVWEDTDVDGVQDAGEPGIGGVTVRLLDEAGAELSMKTTAADGSYRFEELSAGRYVIAVDSPAGYLATDADVGSDDAADSDIDPDTLATAPVDLVEGEANATLDAGFVPLLRVEGRAWFDVNADGLQDPGDDSAEGVIIRLHGPNVSVPSPGFGTIDGPVLQTVMTDAAGRYEFEPIRQGEAFALRPIVPLGGFRTTFRDVGADDTIDSDFPDPTTGAPSSATPAINVSSSASKVDLLDFDVGYRDIEAPVLTVPADFETPTDPDSNTAVVTFFVTAVDNVDPSPAVICTPSSGSDFPLGTTLVTCTATDSAGNTGTGSFFVDVLPGVVLPGVTVTPTGGLITTEGGGTATFTVVLDSEPTGFVSIPVGSSDSSEGNADTGLVNFNAGNWNVPVTVTVTGVDDPDDDGDVPYAILLGEAFGGGYAGIDPPDVSVTNTDDDEPLPPGVTVTPTSGLATSEDGGEATFTVVLNTQPSGPVTIPVSTSDATEGTADVAELTFDAGNWDVAVTVTVIGADDAAVDGDVLFSIVLGAASGGGYTGVDPSDVLVTNKDDDAGGTASISGVVWQDDDFSGTRESGEPRVVGATVKILDASFGLLFATATDGNGEYSFTGLDAGDYRVQMEVAGGLCFPTDQDSGPDDIDSDIDGGSGITEVITVAAGQAVDNVDGGFGCEG